ncbi:MAG: hypothetical protein KF847_18580 [Pirellulales bacterium]|nr:hypothetical protein [Pirellulales bacterium]
MRWVGTSSAFGRVGPLLAWAIVAAAIGCGPDDLAPARGTVRVGGRPAQQGRVVLLPVGGGQPAIGEIGASGEFRLTTGGSHSGAKIASHHVVLKDVACAPNEKPKNYRATGATEFAVEAGVDNALEIDVTVGRGWAEIRDD